MNPWLEIPLEDYEAHMSMASVGQANFLARVLGDVVDDVQPSSVAVIGCSGGNGFDRLPPDMVQRVVGVDINPDYIEATRKRYGGRFKQLELIGEDVLTSRCLFEPVDLIFAGLVFEYLDHVKGLCSLKRFMKPGGYLSAVLQLPSETISAVSPTPYASLKKLDGFLKFVAPEGFDESANSIGLSTQVSRRLALDSGKTFQEFLFSRSLT